MKFYFSKFLKFFQRLYLSWFILANNYSLKRRTSIDLEPLKKAGTCQARIWSDEEADLAASVKNMDLIATNEGSAFC